MVTRNALPQNFIINPHTTLLDSNVVTNWSNNGSLTPSVDAVNGGVKFTTTSPGSYKFSDLGSLNIDFSKCDSIEFDFFVHDYTSLKYLNLYFYTNTDYTGWIKSLNNTYFRAGWNTIVVDKSILAIQGSARSFDSNVVKLRLAIDTETGLNTSVTIGNIRANGKSIEQTIIIIDDGWKSTYTLAYPKMAQYGFKFGVAVNSGTPTENIVGGASYMSWPEIQEMYNSGLADILNHTVSHPASPLLADLTEQQQFDEINNCRLKLIEKGVGGRDCMFVAPSGSFNTTTINILKQLGYKANRSTREGAQSAHVLSSNDNIFKLNCISIGKDDTEDTAMKRLREAKKAGAISLILIHDILTTPDTAWKIQTTKFNHIIDNLFYEKFNVVSPYEFIQYHTNPRKLVSR